MDTDWISEMFDVAFDCDIPQDQREKVIWKLTKKYSGCHKHRTDIYNHFIDFASGSATPECEQENIS